jgi:type I restriction enzyme S subunit
MIIPNKTIENKNSLPAGWRKVKLGEIIKNFDSKRTPLSSIQRARMKGEYPYYGAAGIIDYIYDYIFDGQYLLIAEDGTLTSIGDKPMLQLVNGKFWVNNHAHVIRGKDDLETKFIFYALSTISITPYITGAVQPKLTQENLNNIEILYPNDRTRREKIVDILSAFDEKIELNNKIIKTLEEMAQAIFKEWFVKFKFPGCEKTKFVDSELGKIPEGWKIGHLGDGVCSEIIKPGIEKFDGEKIYLATAAVNETEIVSNSTKITYEKRPIRANSQPKLNSIWFAKMINTYKVLFFFDGNRHDIDKYILSTGFMGIEALKNTQYFLYLFINTKNFHHKKDTLVQGAVQEAITNTNIKQIKILIPPEYLIDRFNENIESLIVKIYKCKAENQKLSVLRDLLLPKLMKGQLKV